MKIAVDCRMSKKSGIGAFIDGILPYFLSSNNDFLLIFSMTNCKKIKIRSDLYSSFFESWKLYFAFRKKNRKSLLRHKNIHLKRTF